VRDFAKIRKIKIKKGIIYYRKFVLF
jgi:hypothetical protein